MDNFLIMDSPKRLKRFTQIVFNPKKILLCIAIGIVPALIFYIISILGLNEAGLDTLEIIRDPAQQSGKSSFIGFLSNIGTWFWVSAAAISFFTAFGVKFFEESNLKRLLFFTGSLSLLLAVDDFFMIHDRYVDPKICYLFYAVTTLTMFWFHLKTILKIEGFAFLTAGSFLAFSIGIDLLQDVTPMSVETWLNSQIVEEAFKFTGATTWLYFIGRVSLKLLNAPRQMLAAANGI